MVSTKPEEGEMVREETTTSRRRLWRLASAVPLPFLLALYALWTHLVTLDGAGFHLEWSPRDFLETLAMGLGTVLLVAAFWAGTRTLRIFAGAIYSLALAFGFGAAGVFAIVHAFGKPDYTAPGWALVALGLTAILCALALLALAALLVDDIRAADAEEA
jgi:hypothetical protein